MNEIPATVQQFREALGRRDRASINEAAAALISMHAPLGMQWQSVAAALKWNGEISLALAAINEMDASLNGHPAARFARANILYGSGRLEEALEQLDLLVASGDGPRTDVERVGHLNFRGSILLLLGRADDARELLTQAIAIDPRSGQAWISFAELADFRGRDSGHVPILEGAFRAGATIAAEASKLAHAVGRMRHQLRDHAGAFAAFTESARLYRADARQELVQPLDELVGQVSSWSPGFIDEIAARITVPHDRVLFVSGLPRSGTTLVEQILVSHPDVETGEEVGFFRLLAQDIGAVDARSFRAWLDRGNDPNQLVELYNHLATERFGPDARFVDKTIEAGNYMGLLLALFPRAPVFWLRRDPIDNGWSAFRTYFARGAGWSWDLGDIGTRLAQEDEMIAYWSRTAADRITFVDYEGLVRDPEPNIRRIAQAAGLEPVEQMFKPHETVRTVATASVSQVREPINLKGLGVAEPYRQWLGPMIAAYEKGRAVNAGSASAS